MMDYNNISINSLSYKKLSDEEKLKVIKFKINKLFKEEGKHKSSFIYHGKKKSILNNRVGLFRDLVAREKKLEKKINDSKNEEFVLEEINIEKNNYTNSDKSINLDDEIKMAENYLNKHGSDSDVLAYLEDLNNKKNKEMVEDNSKVVEEVNDFSINEEEENTEEKVESTIEEKVENNNIYRVTYIKKDNIGKKLFLLPFYLGKTKKYHAEFNNINELKCFLNNLRNENGIIDVKIEKKKKSFVSRFKNLFKKKETEYNLNYINNSRLKKRVGALACAGIILVTGMMGLFKKNNDKVVNPSTKVVTTYNNNNDKDEDKTNEVEEIVDDYDDNISFEDVVSIEDNSKIYTNSYDATYQTNGYDPLYNSSYDREVEALCYELEGSIYTVYKNDVNAMEKVNALENSGAKLTSVLVTRTDLVNGTTHEGYYNNSNVLVRRR